MPAAVVPPPANADSSTRDAPSRRAPARARTPRRRCRRRRRSRPAAAGSHASRASSTSRMPNAERIARVEAQRRLAGDERRAANVRNELAVVACGEPAGEQAAGDALLPPLLADARARRARAARPSSPTCRCRTASDRTRRRSRARSCAQSASARVGAAGDLDVVDRRAPSAPVMPAARIASWIACVTRVSSSTFASSTGTCSACVMKNQLPPYATSPTTRAVARARRPRRRARARAPATFSIVTEPSGVQLGAHGADRRVEARHARREPPEVLRACARRRSGRGRTCRGRSPLLKKTMPAARARRPPAA